MVGEREDFRVGETSHLQQGTAIMHSQFSYIEISSLTNQLVMDIRNA